jgi:Ca2+-binding EF-hand superfamily protein
MTDLSEKELAELREIFDKLDYDKDGKITVQELGLGIKTLSEQCDIDAEMIKFMSEDSMKLMDLDRNGTIEFEEFAKCMSLKEDSDDMIAAAFRLIDRDDDNFITAAEMKYFLASTGEKVSDSDVEETIKIADLNNDGKLNYQGTHFLLNNSSNIFIHLFFFYL